MSGNSVSFRDKKIKKKIFYQKKKIFKIDDINVNKM